MKHQINDDFRAICKEIISNPEDAKIPSDDLLQRGLYVGGYETLEDAFCFSVHLDREYWFQITFEEAALIAAGKLNEVDVRLAE